MPDIITISKNLRKRASWTTARKILVSAGVKCGLGWEATIDKFDPATTPGTAEKKLLESYQDHILCGEKVIYFFEIQEPTITAITKYVDTVKLNNNNPFVSNFPLHTASKLFPKSYQDPVLTSVQKSINGITLVYSSIRDTESRESFDSATLSPAVLNELGGANSVIAIRRERKQVFDIIWIPSKPGTAEVRLDLLRDMKLPSTERAKTFLLKALSTITKSNDFEEPVNLFPLIKNMYTSNEGQVVEMSFVTTTASSKHEKMRRKNLCLRKELYHLGGLKAVHNDIMAYKIAIQWNLNSTQPNRSTPELGLMSKSAHLFLPSPVLDRCHITGCTSINDYHHVVSKIMANL